MQSFSEWLKQLEHPGRQDPDMASYGPKPWKAKKDDIMKHWEGLPTNIPLTKLRSVPVNHKGPTYNFDGMRITGSPIFIDCVLSRLKDILIYEKGQTRLQVIYKQQVDNKSQQPIPQSFVFYLQAKQRESSIAKLPKPKFS
jgi:hypothetical protein